MPRPSLIPREDRAGRPGAVSASEGVVPGADGGRAVRVDKGSGHGRVPTRGGDGLCEEGRGWRGLRVWNSGVRVEDSGMRVWNVGFRVLGFQGFRVLGF